MAHSEACQLFIEEQIQEGLEQGKTPTSIGKELAALLEKWFETSIQPETLRSRARHIQKKRGEITAPTPTPSIPSEIPENQVAGQSLTSSIPDEIPKNQVSSHGGPREGAGRPAKYEKETEPAVQTSPITAEKPEGPMNKPVRSEQGQFAGGTVPEPGRPAKYEEPPKQPIRRKPPGFQF